MTRDELYRRIWSEPLAVVAREVGLSGNALTKVCDRLLIPYPARGYWTKKNSGKAGDRPLLPQAPDGSAEHVTLGGDAPRTLRTRTRMDPSVRKEQLMEVAEQLITKHGLHAVSMKRVAAQAGISETQAYNYGSSWVGVGEF